MPDGGGSLNTTNQEVVAVFGGMSACTGTFVQKNGVYGYVLTAAHCVDDSAPTQVVQGDGFELTQYVVPDFGYALILNFFSPDAASWVETSDAVAATLMGC